MQYYKKKIRQKNAIIKILENLAAISSIKRGQKYNRSIMDPKYQQIYAIVLKRRQKLCRNNKSKETRYQRNNILRQKIRRNG